MCKCAHKQAYGRWLCWNGAFVRLSNFRTWFFGRLRCTMPIFWGPPFCLDLYFNLGIFRYNVELVWNWCIRDKTKVRLNKHSNIQINHSKENTNFQCPCDFHTMLWSFLVSSLHYHSFLTGPHYFCHSLFVFPFSHLLSFCTFYRFVLCFLSVAHHIICVPFRFVRRPFLVAKCLFLSPTARLDSRPVYVKREKQRRGHSEKQHECTDDREQQHNRVGWTLKDASIFGNSILGLLS